VAALEPATATGRKLTFAHDTGFHDEVKRRVQAYFQQTGLSQRDDPRMYLKTAMMLAWFGASYALLVFGASSLWQAALASLSLAAAMAGIGFSVQHDANHGAYSKRHGVNRLMGLTLDLLGASSYLWRIKHNVSHHTYTNLDEADDDINFVPFARLSPAQPRYRLHRLQQFYLWALYWFLFPKWTFVDDFKALAQGQISGHRVPKPRGADLIAFVGGKLVFLGWAFVVPWLFHPWWMVLLFYAATSMVLGTILAVVFMLAHCVEETSFPALAPGTEQVPRSWAENQVLATVDFARGNPLMTWYMGGLNFQIEHHLFPRIAHVHYPHIARIVEATCHEFGVRYSVHESFRGALASHWRWLRRMGRPQLAAAH
jgi:linoleoyl-CoA desaturase